MTFNCIYPQIHNIKICAKRPTISIRINKKITIKNPILLQLIKCDFKLVQCKILSISYRIPGRRNYSKPSTGQFYPSINLYSLLSGFNTI